MAPPQRGLDVGRMWDLGEEVTHGEGARVRQTRCGFCFEEFSHNTLSQPFFKNLFLWVSLLQMLSSFRFHSRVPA